MSFANRRIVKLNVSKYAPVLGLESRIFSVMLVVMLAAQPVHFERLRVILMVGNHLERAAYFAWLSL